MNTRQRNVIRTIRQSRCYSIILFYARSQAPAWECSPGSSCFPCREAATWMQEVEQCSELLPRATQKAVAESFPNRAPKPELGNQRDEGNKVCLLACTAVFVMRNYFTARHPGMDCRDPGAMDGEIKIGGNYRYRGLFGKTTCLHPYILDSGNSCRNDGVRLTWETRLPLFSAGMI